MNNPVVHVVSKLVIAKLEIPECDTLIINIRNTDCSLLNGNIYSVGSNLSLPLRVASRMNFNLNTLKLRTFVKNLDRQFFIYGAWDYEEVMCISNLPSCIGKFYLEEGQNAYIVNGNVEYSKWTWNNFSARPIYFKTSYSGAFCLTESAFPWMHPSQKTTLSDLTPAKQAYRPKLSGIKNIGLMPQPHRIPKDKWKSAIDLLSEKVGDRGAIKLHPGFFAVPQWLNEIKQIISMSSNDSIVFCDNTEILELEMLFNKKNFFGARTSIEKYASVFGSKFEVIRFDGYIPSNLPEI